MTAGSVAVSDLKESSVWGSWPDQRPWPGRKLVNRYARFAQTCPDSAAASEVRAAPNPRAFTRVVWGLISRPPGSPGGLSSGFPFARRGSSPSSAFGWFPFVWRSPVLPFGRRPVRVPLRFPSGFPSPGSLHVSAAAGRCRRRWPRSARTKVTSSASAPSLGSPAIRPRCRRAVAGHERCRRRIAWYERPRAYDVTASSRNR